MRCCRTDLHVVDGELSHPKLPIVPGHEIVGRVAARGTNARHFSVGERIGIPWLGWTCGECRYCRDGHENLCADARFTGYQIDGGYAEYTVADARYCFRIPDTYSDVEAAPLLYAGLIGYRALKIAGDAGRIGIYGFGAAAHIVAQILRYHEQKLFAFTRPGWAIQIWRRQKNSTPPLFSCPWALSCPPRCDQFARVELSSVEEST